MRSQTIETYGALQPKLQNFSFCLGWTYALALLVSTRCLLSMTGEL